MYSELYFMTFIVLTVVRFGINYNLGRRNSHMAGLDSGASALVLATVFWPHLRYHKHGSLPITRYRRVVTEHDYAKRYIICI